MATDPPAAAVEDAAERRDALASRLVQAMLGTMDLLNLYLGDRLGLYRALAAGAATPAELAQLSGIHPRYAREWLEQQAVSGLLAVDDGGKSEEERRYSLPPGHGEVLLERDSLSYLGYLGRFASFLGQTTPRLLELFRTGDGLSWGDFGEDARVGQSEQNRPIFLHLLGRAWLPEVPDVDARLRAAPPARVADIGCGEGWSSIAIAKAYPTVQVDGFDFDEPSIQAARTHAAAAGVDERVHFHARDAADPSLSGSYDLVVGFEMLHDLARPIEVLRTMRRLLAEGGSVLIVDEKVAEVFTAPGDELERLFYGFSTLCCLPAGMAEQPSAATGTVMRPATLRRYADAAGFPDVEILPIEHDLFRIYRLRP